MGKRRAMMGRLSRAALVALAATVLAFWPEGEALAQGVGIDATKHDLTGGGVDEICVFCHTPHGSNTDVAAPLWNKPQTGQTYQTYDSTTIDGQVLAVGSVSIACLTCHDGTQSTDVVINAPGSGGYNPLGTAIRGGGRELDDPSKPDHLGTDLTNDHPIGIQYGGFDPGGGVIDPDFKTDGGPTPGLQSAVVDGRPRWWVDTEGTPNGLRNKTDMILYTRNDPGDPAAVPPVPAGPDQPFVECASCHDPHTDDNPTFLRTSNTGSGVCLACHVK